MLLAVAPIRAGAQQWNNAPTMALVNLAIGRRAVQLADTGLTDYKATAHGYLTFLAQMGEGFPDPPKVVRTDELGVEVYWRAPSQSKQRIVGRRDTLLLPTDINYHRDHLAIIQNNFPSIIRLGDGDEVHDVPHPLSAQGRDEYDFAITDSLLIRTSDRVFDVVEVKVRPKNDRLARAVGAVYLDRANGSVVRMTFSFTRQALKDPQLEDVSVILENGLVDGRFWLPRRQEIEIRRTGSWMDFPARGIIRGRWEICCVETNQTIPAPLFTGPEIVQAPPEALRAYPFKGAILEGLSGDVKLSENDDVRRVQEEARELVRAEALARTQATVPSVRSLSDIVHMNRNEGIAIGTGVTRRFGGGVTGVVRARFGTGDHAFKESVSLGWQRANGMGISLTARDDFREAGDTPEASGVRNSIASQEFGSDFTDFYQARGVTLGLDFGVAAGVRWRAKVERELQAALGIHATPATGHFPLAFPAQSLRAWRYSLEGYRAPSPGPFGSSIQGTGELRASAVTFDGAVPGAPAHWVARGAVEMTAERPLGADRLVMRTAAAGVLGPEVPYQELIFLGGPVSAPGYDYHELSARAAVSERIEWRHPVFAIPLSLGRYGHLRMPVTLAPFGQVIGTLSPSRNSAIPEGWFGAVGVGILTVFDLVRIEVARGVRNGRWTFSLDFSRDLWRIL